MESGPIIPLPTLIDLALGSPEVGAINFNILHSVLHVIIEQTNLYGTQVEFKDPSRLESLIGTVVTPTVKLEEFELTVESPENHEGETQTVVTIESVAGGEKPTFRPGVKERHKKPDVKTPAEAGVIVPKGSIDKLEKQVSQIQEQMEKLDALPSNENLISRSRTSAETPVTDMWQILNLQKRMDAAEEGIGKLTSVLEDLAKQTGFAEVLEDMPVSASEKQESPETEGCVVDKEVEKRLWDIENRLSIVERRAPVSRPEHGAEQSGSGALLAVSAPREPVTYDGLSLEEVVNTIQDELGTLKSEMDGIVREIQHHLAVTENLPFELLMDVGQILEELKSKVQAHSDLIGGSALSCNKLQELENKVLMNTSIIQGLEASFSSQVENIQLQVADVEKEMGIFLERLNTDNTMRESASQDFSGMTEVYNKIQTLQNELDSLNNTASKLMDDRDERQMHINALLEQIELLKMVKADKEDLEDALAEKADHNAVNRKVSHDQFDAACDDLSRGLEEALGKLTQQEVLWQQALDDVQHEIDNKLDRVEISPLKDFVNAKLKNLHERLKALAAIRKDIEAAGTKRRLLRNVKCISCDKDVVMKIDNELPLVPAKEGLPPSRSMRPYLTYELDSVRKQQRRLPQGRNMLYYEEAMHGDVTQRSRPKESPRGAQRPKDHLCNRYCGGSHTVTTAQQRVSRVGHFLMQWGPEAIQLMEGEVKGTDGRLYKARGQPFESPAMVSETTETIGEAPGQPEILSTPGDEIPRQVLEEMIQLPPPEILKEGEALQEGVTLGSPSKDVVAEIMRMIVKGGYPSGTEIAPATGESGTQVVAPATEESGTQEAPATEESGTQEVPATEESGTQEAPPTEESETKQEE